MRKRSGWWILPALAGIVAGGNVSAEILTRDVEYEHEGVKLKGYLAYDSELPSKGKLPGVLIIHEWWGLNDYAKRRARMLAELGYAAFAADMYGAGKVTDQRDQAAKWSGELYGSPLIRSRARAGLDVLANLPFVDVDRMAAIGYCFGGTTVLELAYSGAPLRGVVSFHGGLTAPNSSDYDQIKAKFLILHGADDPFVSQEKILETQKGLREAGVDWQMIYYGGAMHSFTNPAADGSIPGAQYNAKADARSWEHMRLYFREIMQGN